MARAIDYGLYLVTDRAAARGRGLGMIVRAAVQGGASVVQLRDKDASTRDSLQLAHGAEGPAGASGGAAHRQ
jgi:thiamine monophosphate synthase